MTSEQAAEQRQHPDAWINEVQRFWQSGCDTCGGRSERSDYRKIAQIWKDGHDAGVRATHSVGVEPATLDEVVLGLARIEQLLLPQRYILGVNPQEQKMAEAPRVPPTSRPGQPG